MIRSSLLCLAWCFCAAIAQAADGPANNSPGNYLQRADVDAYIASLVAKHEFDREALRGLFAEVEYRKDIIERMLRPAEKVWTWARYQAHLVDEPRVAAGVEFWHQHGDTLARAEATYGVPPEVVLAILGIETRYGRIVGTFPVLDALVTLGFDYPPRGRFFRKELTEFLLLAREENKAPKAIVGSYAGAMGYGQFIPSSYRHYAVDFDGDGLRDIWTNPVDAVGSIGNYFARHRWSGDQPRALRVSVSGDAAAKASETGLSLNRTVAELRDAGVVGFGETGSAEATDAMLAGLDGATLARLYRLDGAEGSEWWLALPDFYVITRYNHSHMYALAVHQLAQAIRARYDAGDGS